MLETNGKTKIIDWSGGPDSTLCLIDLLQYTTDPVVAYHIFTIPTNTDTLSDDYDLNQPDEKLENKAVEQLTPLLKEKYRDFEVRNVVIKIPQNPDNFYESGLFSVLNAIEQQAEYYFGMCVEDAHIWDHIGNSVHHFFKKRQLLEQYFTDLQIIKYNAGKPKKQIRKELGEKIWKLTWSCINPTPNNKPCGYCPKCLVNNKTKTSTRKKKASTNKTND